MMCFLLRRKSYTYSYICTGQILWVKVLKYIYSNREVSRYDDAHFICCLTERN